MTGSRLEKGGLIDRRQKVTFRFNGRSVTGFKGDTIASALLASGHMLVGRSFKYHRPRGVMSAGVEEGGALFNTGDGAERVPNVKGTVTEIKQGLTVYSQNVFPSPKFDLGAVNGLIAPFITAGFYYKTFMGPFASTRFWMFCEAFIRKAAGLGRASRQPDPASYDIAHGFCDALVIGSGPAGLTAAARLSEQGLKVIVVEQDFDFGGDWLARADKAKLARRDQLIAQIEAAGGRLMARSTAFGLYDGHVAGVIERCTDHLVAPHADLPREIFHIIRARHIVLATGALERGLALGNNDKPGVMLAHALTSYAGRYGVLAGRSAVLATCHDGTYEDALFLAEKGMQITLLDARAKPCALHRQATEAGISVLQGCVPVNIVGGRCVAGVEIGHLGPDDRVDDTRQIIGCDVVGLSGGWSPVINLLSHRGVKPVWNERLQGFLGGKTKENIHMIGSADGLYDEDSVLLSAEKLAASLTGQAMNGRLQRGWSSPIRPVYEIRTARKLKAFIDPQHDVTTADIRQARLEGFTSVEHMKRYTTLGMATDQGRMGNVLGIAAMADALQQTIADTGITTFRPPFTPVSIGALAGRYSGTHWVPTRRTPMHHQHLAAGAEMTDAGLWKRPWYYPRDDETIEDAYIREAGTTRQTVGMVDVSTLGKIAVQGPDATEFLNRLYINAFAKLPVGRARYGVMLRDDGMVLDDGTTWRLADDDYFMTTTTAQAAPVMQFMEELLQTRWTDLRVHLTSVTDLWAGMAVAGPLARQLLSTAVAELDWSDAAFPFMAVRHSRIKIGRAFIDCRIARISFSGEMAFELYVNAEHGAVVWQHLAGLVGQAGGCLYGMEALGTLRIEKGHVTAAELDGRVTLEDAGFTKMASAKKPYIGSVLRKRPHLQDTNRPKLVGILPKDRSRTFGSGAILCAKGNVSGFGEGWITAVTHSPVFGHYIGLGFISGGAEAWAGRTAIIADPIRGQTIEAEIVSPHMFDPAGDRQHG